MHASNSSTLHTRLRGDFILAIETCPQLAALKFLREHRKPPTVYTVHTAVDRLTQAGLYFPFPVGESSKFGQSMASYSRKQTRKRLRSKASTADNSNQVHSKHNRGGCLLPGIYYNGGPILPLYLFFALPLFRATYTEIELPALGCPPARALSAPNFLLSCHACNDNLYGRQLACRQNATKRLANRLYNTRKYRIPRKQKQERPNTRGTTAGTT